MPYRAVTEFMTSTVVTLSPESDVQTAGRTLLKHRISGAPVVDAEGRLLGVLSEKDCLRALVRSAFEGWPASRVEDSMTRDVDTISPSATLYDVVQLFAAHSYRRLPVVDDERRVVGQVSRRDALIAIESIRDNSFLYGSEESRPPETPGVDSAMRVARGKK